ncbi:MAG TPA: hypothetical protein VLM42_12765, partial [Bryobacteraceae bacterium]|nr:hypothetical protein [Bryobacteraceae bacterium]
MEGGVTGIFARLPACRWNGFNSFNEFAQAFGFGPRQAEQVTEEVPGRALVLREAVEEARQPLWIVARATPLQARLCRLPAGRLQFRRGARFPAF